MIHCNLTINDIKRQYDKHTFVNWPSPFPRNEWNLAPIKYSLLTAASTPPRIGFPGIYLVIMQYYADRQLLFF